MTLLPPAAMPWMSGKIQGSTNDAEISPFSGCRLPSFLLSLLCSPVGFELWVPLRLSPGTQNTAWGCSNKPLFTSSERNPTAPCESSWKHRWRRWRSCRGTFPRVNCGDFGGEGPPAAHNAQLAPFQELDAGLGSADLAWFKFKLVQNFRQRPFVRRSWD